MKPMLRWSALAVVVALVVIAAAYGGWATGAGVAFFFLIMMAFFWRAGYASEGIQNWSRARFDDDPHGNHWSKNTGPFFDHRNDR